VVGVVRFSGHGDVLDRLTKWIVKLFLEEYPGGFGIVDRGDDS